MKKQRIKDNVAMILSMSEKARGDDKTLLLLYWKWIDRIDFSNFEEEFLEKGTMAESIRRQRQLLQEDGHYLPSEDIIEERRLRQKSMRKSVKEHRMVI
ncbi:hypothetical protein V7094_25505 [Priestia megaterium]|uniref:hypothetical protein n=1 Tax=Priestia megaterium TaxID=1404 RepID=UPI002FFFD898